MSSSEKLFPRFCDEKTFYLALAIPCDFRLFAFVVFAACAPPISTKLISDASYGRSSVWSCCRALNEDLIFLPPFERSPTGASAIT